MLAFLRRPPQSKASATGPLAAIHGTGRAVWTPRDLASLTRQSYLTNAIAHRCVRLIAESAASIPMRVSEQGRVQTDHPALALLRRPNPAQDCCALMESLYGHLQIAGNAYLEAVPSATGTPGELYTLRPDRMRVIPGTAGWPEGYEYRVGHKSIRFAQSEEAAPILHIKTFHPLDDHYGLSPLEAAAIPVDVHNAASRWNKALLDNAARPSGAMVYSGPDGSLLAPDQYERLKDQLEARHQGAENAGRPILLEGGLDWKPMGFSPSDMEFMKGKDAAAREIALAFGVPPLILGLPGDNTHANYAEANRAFHAQTIRPLVGKTLSALSHWLAPKYGGNLLIEPVEEGEEPATKSA
jgi:HK97 family phage portal protein